MQTIKIMIVSMTTIAIAIMAGGCSKDEASSQINSKKYPIAYKYDGREIVKIGVNISTDGDVRTITEWKVEN